MAYRDIPNLVINDARITSKNFSGKPTDYSDGVRSFCVGLEEEDALRLRQDGWNVKTKISPDEDEPARYYLPVTVSFDNWPPKVVLVNEGGENVQLEEEDLHLLDDNYILHADVAIRPYQWTLKTGKSGVKAYLKTLYATLEHDEFEDKYAR